MTDRQENLPPAVVSVTATLHVGGSISLVMTGRDDDDWFSLVDVLEALSKASVAVVRHIRSDGADLEDETTIVTEAERIIDEYQREAR